MDYEAHDRSVIEDLERQVADLQSRLDAQIAGHRKTAKDATDNLVRANAAERALAERAGGVERFVGNIPGSSSASGFAPLTAEPAAPEGRQDDEPRAYIVHAPEDDYYGTGPDRLQFHPLAQHDMDNGYRQTPLYGRPAEQAVTEAMVDAGARAIAKAWGEEWECCCSERRGLDCDCGDAMTDDHDGYEEHLSRDDCRMAARAALKAAMEAGG